jgi:predicted transcriptional regulator
MSTAEHSTPRDQMIAILNQQPADSTYDDLLRELACRRAILRGLADVQEGRIVDHEEALRRIRSWRS